MDSALEVTSGWIQYPFRLLVSAAPNSEEQMIENKTLHICTLCYQPYTHTTGVERFALGITQGLKDIGINVEIVSAENPISPGHKVNFPKTGIGIIDNLLFSLFSLPKLMDSKYDIIHVHGHITGVFPALLKKSGLLRKQLIYTAHGLVYSHLMENNLWLFNQTHHFEKLILRNADMVFNGNTSDIDKIAQYAQIDKNKVKYLYTGGINNIFKPSNKIEARQILGIPSYQRIVLFVGTLEYRKGIDLLIGAMSGLPNIHLYLIGKATPFSEKVLKGSSLHNVHRSGHVPTDIPESLLPVWYSAADVFILPSRYESFGLVLLEAMACGTPTISSNIPQIKEAFGEATYSISLNIDELRKSILFILNNSNVQKSLIKKGLELAESKSWKIKAKEVLKSYQKKE